MKVIAFDVFNTVFDLSSRPREEVIAYGNHIRKNEWSPLVLPQAWETLPAHSDAAEGIARLRTRFFVATLSNGPLGLLAKVSKHNGISWDAIVPLELGKVFKPNLLAYSTFCGILNVEPKDVMMVTANRTFGDLEAADKLGMDSCLIRDPKHSEIHDIIELATYLGV
jgi:2-haloalkanoic acid dehalogenase type II